MKAILNRKNALFYKRVNGAAVGDLFMSLIHTCELNGASPFDYLTGLQRYAEELKRSLTLALNSVLFDHGLSLGARNVYGVLHELEEREHIYIRGAGKARRIRDLRPRLGSALSSRSPNPA